MLLGPWAAHGRHRVEKVRHDFSRKPQQTKAFAQRQQILRLTERHRFTVAAPQTGETRGRTFDNFDAEIAGAEPVRLQQLARRNRDGAGLVGEADQATFQIGDGFNFRPGD